MNSNKRKKLIVISNDDGIKAKGLKSLYRALKGLGEIVVIAPDRGRSGASHSLSLCSPLTVKSVNFEGIKVYSVTGTPVDCVKLALLKICKRRPALVATGINHGANTGSNIIYSGTVGAAAEAALVGIPAIAASIDSFDPDADFSAAEKYIKEMAGAVLSGAIRAKKFTLFNMNFPHGRKIEGVKVVPKGRYEYDEFYFSKRVRGGERLYLDLREKRGMRHKKHKGVSDIEAIREGYATITPLHFDLTDYEECGFIRKGVKSGKIFDF